MQTSRGQGLRRGRESKDGRWESKGKTESRERQGESLQRTEGEWKREIEKFRKDRGKVREGAR